MLDEHIRYTNRTDRYLEKCYKSKYIKYIMCAIGICITVIYLLICIFAAVGLANINLTYVEITNVTDMYVDIKFTTILSCDVPTRYYCRDIACDNIIINNTYSLWYLCTDFNRRPPSTNYSFNSSYLRDGYRNVTIFLWLVVVIALIILCYEKKCKNSNNNMEQMHEVEL